MAHDTLEGVRTERNCRLQQEMGPLVFPVHVYPQDRGVRTKIWSHMVTWAGHWWNSKDAALSVECPSVPLWNLLPHLQGLDDGGGRGGGVPANSWNPTQISLHVCEKTEKEMKQVAKSIETWTAASGHGAIGFCFSVSLTFMFIGFLWVPFPPVWARKVLALFPQLVSGMVGSWIA